jgi:hypothetical protein
VIATLLFAPSRDPKQRPRRLATLAGREQALRHQLHPQIACTPSRCGSAIAAALLLGGAPEVYAMPIAQLSSVSDDFSAAETVRLGKVDGLSPRAWLITPLGTPTLLQPIQGWSQLGLGFLPLPAISWPEPAAFQPMVSQPETLEQVLRSIATVHPRLGTGVSPPNMHAQPGVGSPGAANYAQNRGLSAPVLQSETGAAVMRAIVDTMAVEEHGVTFSVLDMGNFEPQSLNAMLEFMVPDLSNRWPVTFSLTGDPNRAQYSADLTRATDDSRGPRFGLSSLRLAVAWVLEFLTTPIGILLAALSGLVLLGWATISTVIALRGTPSRHHRAFRRTQEASTTIAPRRKRRGTTTANRRSRRRFRKHAPQG